MKYIFGKTIQLKFPVCYFPLHLAPWCQSDCKTLILFFFLIAFVCFRKVAASLIPSRKLIKYIFWSLCSFSKCFSTDDNSSDFRVGSLALRLLVSLKCLWGFGNVLVFVLEFSYLCVDISYLHWLQGRFGLRCRVECRSNLSSELKISLFSLDAPAYRMQHCFSNTSIHRHWWRMLLLPHLPQREEEEVLDCLGSLFSNASRTTANSQQHSGIF